MRELLLNENSLDGQFQSINDFYNTLPEMSENLQILSRCGIGLLKHSSLYSRKITKELTLYDLANRRDKIAPLHRDKVLRWKRRLFQLITAPPFWDSESGECSPEMEAARRSTDLLSFSHSKYEDICLELDYHDKKCFVYSCVSTGYLLQRLFALKWIDRVTYLKHNFKTKKIRMDYIDSAMESIRILEKNEFDELLVGLLHFEQAVSWEEITHDRFFNYKEYHPAGNKKNVFSTGVSEGKKIDKFRCGQHSQIRCFGFREKDCFYVITVERDHHLSDKG